MRQPLSRRLASALTAVAVLASASPALAFSDVSASTKYSVAIKALEAKGVIKGYEDGTFKPGNRINRAEFLKIVIHAAYDQATIDELLSRVKIKGFTDVMGDEWFAQDVYFATAKGIIGGYPDGSFRPNQDITFVEAAKIITLAYGQQAQGYGEWYEPFARALESAKAIPPTVAALDRPITRGEMAEMIWRLSENRTDQPTKGFLNVKHPELSVNMASDDVQNAKSCVDLRAFATEAAAANTGGEMYYDKAQMGAPAPTANRAEDSAATLQTGGGGDYSETNVQVAGVDEADIVKTDGTYLYIVRNDTKSLISIVKANPASALKEEGRIDLTNDGISAREMYVENGRLVVIGPEYGSPVIYDKRAASDMMIRPGYYPMQQQRTVVRIYDVRDAANPKMLRSVAFQGDEVSSRKIGNKTYLVLRQQPAWWGGPIPLADDKLVPLMEDSKIGRETPVARCADVAILPYVPSPQYMTVAVIRTDDANADVQTEVVLGSAENVYASAKNLYVATTDWQYNWDAKNPTSSERTRLYRFSLADNGVSFADKGSVPGRILNQFSMDENGSTFRIATTEGQSWDETHRSTNSLYTLNLALEPVGKVTDIAPGETIYSVRFMGNRAYMVTFKTVDPFFVIDLTDARNPKILGQLKIPGFSNYLHPYDDNHVIGFGKEVDESIDKDKVHTDDAIYYTAIQGMKISMFDVSDVSNPTEKWKTVIGDRGTESPLLNDHKALLFEKDKGLLSFPVLVTKTPAGQPKSADGQPVFQGAYVYDVSLTKGFTLKGTVTHYDDDSVFLKSGSYWYGGEKDVQRVVRIGESLYTISPDEVRGSALSDLRLQGKVVLK